MHKDEGANTSTKRKKQKPPPTRSATVAKKAKQDGSTKTIEAVARKMKQKQQT
jgi:hypothetical protein